MSTVLIAKAFGIAISVLGLAIFAAPVVADRLFAFFQRGRWLYLAGVIRLTVGGVLLAAASASTVPLAAIALGTLFVTSGVIVFVLNPSKARDFIAAYRNMPGIVIRLLGLVAATFGILIYSIF